MTKIEDVLALASGVVEAVGFVNVKLDEVKVFIETLKGPEVVTDEQLDQVISLLAAAKSELSSVLVEADSLDETATPFEP